jgi:hypothetical protein
MEHSDDESGRSSPGAGSRGLDPASGGAAESPEHVTQAMATRRHRAHRQRRVGGEEGPSGRHRHRRSKPPACALVGPEEMCRGPSFHEGLPSVTHRHVAEADRIPQPIYLGEGDCCLRAGGGIGWEAATFVFFNNLFRLCRSLITRRHRGGGAGDAAGKRGG